MPIAEDTREFLKNRFAELARSMPWLVDLEKKLLSIGGEALVPRDETREVTELIVKAGRLFPTKYRRMAPGEGSNCHGNTAILFANGLKIATSYTLVSDGLWRQHSWGIESHKTKSGKRVERIVETTTKRDLYFGYRLDTRSGLEFARANLGSNAPAELHTKLRRLVPPRKRAASLSRRSRYASLDRHAPGSTGCGRTHGNCHSEEPAGDEESAFV